MSELISAEEAVRSAGGLDPSVPRAFQAADLLRGPVFETAFTSALFPELSGPVAIRYPSFSDLLEIERIAQALGGGAVAEWAATLRVCLEKAPHGWWKASKDRKDPELNLGFQDGDALQSLYREYLLWRRSVRGTGLRRPAEGT